jgi:hypothetical protein
MVPVPVGSFCILSLEQELRRNRIKGASAAPNHLIVFKVKILAANKYKALWPAKDLHDQ